MSEIKPAMTADEWYLWTSMQSLEIERAADGLAGEYSDSHAVKLRVMDLRDYGWDQGMVFSTYANIDGEHRPVEGSAVGVDETGAFKLAAALLEHRPYGFTWDDVDTLRATAAVFGDGGAGPVLSSLSDRVAALLPPRGLSNE